MVPVEFGFQVTVILLWQESRCSAVKCHLSKVVRSRNENPCGMSYFLVFQELSCHLQSRSFFRSINFFPPLSKTFEACRSLYPVLGFFSVVKRDVIIDFLFITGWLVFLWYRSCNGRSKLCQDSWWSCCEFEWYCCYEGIHSE